MGIPAIIGASLSELLDAAQAGEVAFSAPLLVGMVVSAIVGFGAIKLLSWLVKTDRFGIFAYYALALGVIVLIIGIFEHIAGGNIVGVINEAVNQGVN